MNLIPNNLFSTWKKAYFYFISYRIIGDLLYFILSVNFGPKITNENVSKVEYARWGPFQSRARWWNILWILMNDHDYPVLLKSNVVLKYSRRLHVKHIFHVQIKSMSNPRDKVLREIWCLSVLVHCVAFRMHCSNLDISF